MNRLKQKKKFIFASLHKSIDWVGRKVSDHPSFLKIGVKDVLLGKNVTIIEPSNIYGCDIGDDVFIGPFVEIQKNVKIGPRTRVQSHSFLCELVTIGEDCFIAHGVMFINDLFSHGGPANGDQSLWRKTLIGDRVSIGSNATILPVSICSDVVIGAGSVVTKSIDQSGIYCGNPAVLLRTIHA